MSSPSESETGSAARRSIPLLVSNAEQAAYVSLKRSLNLGGDSYYAECRFGARRQLDLLVAFHRPSASSFELASRLTSADSPFFTSHAREWETARQFTTRWLRADSELRRLVSTLWFEFDDVVARAEAAGPSLSACLVTGYSKGFEPAPEPDREQDAAQLLAVYRELAADRADSAEEARLCHAARALPDHGKLIHLSLMSARAPESVKVYGVVPRGELTQYLRRVGWRGAYDAVEHALAQIATLDLCGEYLYFDLNLSNMESSQSATLGIAFSQQQLLARGAGPARSELLGRLNHARQLSASQRETLERWVTSEASGLSLDQLPGGHRWLDIKLVIDPTGAFDSKAYLGFASRRGPFA
jgi:hypothetical protein